MVLHLRPASRVPLGVLVAGLLASYLLFPVLTALVVQPFEVTLDYRVAAEGASALRFDHFTWLDPATVFHSGGEGQTAVEVANAGRNTLRCWISDYEGIGVERLFGQPHSIVDQPPGRLAPGALLQDCDKRWRNDPSLLGSFRQRYCTFVLEPQASARLSFGGRRRRIECPPQPGAKLAWSVDGRSETVESLNQGFATDVAFSGRNRRVVLFVPPYAFGSFHVTGPEGFVLTRGELRQLGSSEPLSWGWIPFPWSGLLFTMASSFGLAALAAAALRHAWRLARALPSRELRLDTPLLAPRDLAFLIVSGSIVLTFAGSVPPIHMWDSIGYVGTAARLPELFSTFAYPPYRSPGYPILIWSLRYLMGPGYGLVLVQQTLFFVSAFLLFKTVEYLSGGRRAVAWAAGLMYLLNPLNLIFSQFIQPEGLWRDLVVAWTFSLVLLLKRSRWAAPLAGSTLGLLWLSRSSGLPFVLLAIAVGCLLAWNRVSVLRYAVVVCGLVALCNAPYQAYLRAAGTHGQAYVAAVLHTHNFMPTLDSSAGCFYGMQQDFHGTSSARPVVLPWMTLDLMGPLNGNDAQTLSAVAKSREFERCVWTANYLRFPAQQLSVLGRRMLSFLWTPEMKDLDLWPYKKIYTRRFLQPGAGQVYSENPTFRPYYYSEKWDVQDFPSAWKALFEALYHAWPFVELGLLLVAAALLLSLHAVQFRKRGPPGDGTLELLSLLVALYVAEAALYSGFGVALPRRIMLAVAPLMLVVFGAVIGLAADVLRRSDLDAAP